MRVVRVLLACVTTIAASVPLRAAPDPTFTRDVAPLIYTHCASCHRPGGSAPFSLLTYDDVRPRTRQIAMAVERRLMPPWTPDGPPGTFIGDPRLSEDERGVVRRWVAAGAPRGNPGDQPVPPTFTNDWELQEPDLVLRLERPYRLAPGGREQLRNFVVRVPIDETSYVTAWEFKTTAPGVVHHATLMVDRGARARGLDAATPDSGYEGVIPFSAQSPDGYFLGWTPGQRARMSPPGMAWRVDPGDDLIVMLHLAPGERAEDVDASVALHLSHVEPSDQPVMVRLNRQDLDIPAGVSTYRVTDEYSVPVDVELYTIQPHAHYLATRLTLEAESASEGRRTLFSISRWNFQWQDVYLLGQPLHLPAHTRLRMTMEFDNSVANRSNPHSPPARVIWGQRSSDEMADVWLQVVASRTQDRDRLVSDLRRTMVPKDIDGYLKMLEVEPLNTALHDDLALLAMEAGNTALAATHFAEVLRLRPTSASAHYNLGNVLLLTGRTTEALSQFGQALGLDPAHGLAHQGRGLALSRLGRMDEAIAALAAAAGLLPDSVDVAYNLGVVNQQRGRNDDALAAYVRVMRLAPGHAEARYGAALIHEARGDYRTALQLFKESDQLRSSVEAMTEVAWLRAAAPSVEVRDAAEAVMYGERARRLAPRNPHVLDVLAAALAAAGRYGEAVQRTQEALATLDPAADPALGDAIRARLKLYESMQPFVLP